MLQKLLFHWNKTLERQESQLSHLFNRNWLRIMVEVFLIKYFSKQDLHTFYSYFVHARLFIFIFLGPMSAGDSDAVIQIAEVLQPSEG